LILLTAFSMRAAIEVVTDAATASVFGNGRRTIRFQFRNSGGQPVEAKLSFRLFQVSSSMLAPLGEARTVRSFPLGAGQTVVESVEVELPPVRGESGFQLSWFDSEKKVGTTSVRVFPDDLLRSLSTLGGDTPVGVLDPEGHFKSALAALRPTELKEAEDLSSTESRLILIAPMAAANRPAGLLNALKKRALNGAAVVWVQSPGRPASETWPEAYLLNEGTGRVVIAAAGAVLPLAESPRAQLRLVHLAELATGKARLDWPSETP
jgi:hypothetical protein